MSVEREESVHCQRGSWAFICRQKGAMGAQGLRFVVFRDSQRQRPGRVLCEATKAWVASTQQTLNRAAEWPRPVGGS